MRVCVLVCMHVYMYAFVDAGESEGYTRIVIYI